MSNIGSIAKCQILVLANGKISYSKYSGTLVIGPHLGRTKTGQIGIKVVTLSRWPECMLSPTAGQSQMGHSKSGPISRWSDCQGGHIPRFHCTSIARVKILGIGYLSTTKRGR